MMRMVAMPEPNQHSIAEWFPAVVGAVSTIIEDLVEQGLEVYPRNGQWAWRWRLHGVESGDEYDLQNALIDALSYRLLMPSSARPILDE